MVRQIVIASAMVASATFANAQPAPFGAAPSPAPRPTPAPARPPVRVVRQPRTIAPPIVFPSAPAGGLTPPVTFVPGSATLQPRDLFRSPDRFQSLQPFPYGIGYGYAPYETDPQAAAQSSGIAPAAATGLVRLSGTPGEAQVLVDSYFVGTLGDIESGRPMTIDAGPHRLEVRAPGYQSTAIDIRVTPHEMLTYRAALERLMPTPPTSAAAARPPSPMYVIPNCYAGNVPPRADRLPSGCDVKQMKVLGDK